MPNVKRYEDNFFGSATSGNAILPANNQFPVVIIKELVAQVELSVGKQFMNEVIALL